MGVEQEKQQTWSGAADTYYHALSCLSFLDKYLRTHGTLVDQHHVYKYTEHFKYRRSFVVKKMHQ